MGDIDRQITEKDASTNCTDNVNDKSNVDEILSIKLPDQLESTDKINLAGDIGTQTVTEKLRMPAVFTGAEDTPSSRRRHVRKNLFEDETQPGQDIFSYKGKRGVNIQRHQDSVTVFPSGCMGINDKLKEKENGIISPRRYLNPSEMQVPQTRLIGFTPRKRPSSAQSNVAARNPLTGEGYNDSDFIRHGALRKKDGNPVLGEGYKDGSTAKSGKIPPGGYSTGLW